MRKSKTLARIANNETVRMCCLGHFVPAYVKFAAHYEYDCIWLDCEHRNFTERDVQTLLVHSHLHDIDIMVRPSTREKTKLYRYLEDGAAGLMIPHVNTAEQAAALVSAVKFPPVGDRGLDGAGLDADYFVNGMDGVNEFLAEANNETFLVVQAETPESIKNIEAIAATPGLDGIFVGPGDLGLRIRQTETELTLEAAFEAVAAACKRHGIAWGTPVGTVDDLAKRQRQGAQLLARGGDFAAMKDVLQAGAESFKQTPRE
ncbi:HpcH/HpaI aldolase family protein [Thalassoroseus pseudoceratinae]|uniref:HpcH/HpaI aldolase family protein n=1 Tax=Thalassoroseus pseudoceratinae TaxID=2713176 RepID=UPI00141E524E|nr:aldolase/citrate lyase family protein [Thalassoroseus pseudoceratinae]